jgi:plasmid stability protein
LINCLRNRLQQRAEYYGRYLEEEAKEILRAVLTENSLESEHSLESLNLAKAIEQRFAQFGDFEIPTIARDPFT